jgi:hypothetical protein
MVHYENQALTITSLSTKTFTMADSTPVHFFDILSDLPGTSNTSDLPGYTNISYNNRTYKGLVP